jgi:hypothetical protein
VERACRFTLICETKQANVCALAFILFEEFIEQRLDFFSFSETILLASLVKQNYQHGTIKFREFSSGDVKLKLFPKYSDHIPMIKNWNGPFPLNLQDSANSRVSISYVRGTKENYPNVLPLLQIPIGALFDQQVEKNSNGEALVVSHQNIRWTWKQFQVPHPILRISISRMKWML